MLVPVLLRRYESDQQAGAHLPHRGNQNAEQITLTLVRLIRETANDKIAVVLDSAGFHHAKAVTDLHEPGQALARIRPIYLPPYVPDHNPIEHVWNTAKENISNTQRDNPEETLFLLNLEHVCTGAHRPVTLRLQ